VKIKLAANAQIELPTHLSHVNTSYGFAYYNKSTNEFLHMQKDNSFSVKLLEKLENFFKLGMNDSQKHFTEIIAQTIDYSNRTLGNNHPELIAGVRVQINAKTPFNDKLQELSDKNKYLSRAFRSLKPALEGFNSKVGHIRLGFRQIELGTEHDLFQNYIPETGGMRHSLTRPRMIAFMFFHELGHHLEFAHRKNHTHPIFISLLSKLNLLQREPNHQDVKHLQQQIDESALKDTLGKINPALMQFWRSFAMECYADTSGVLSQHNFNLEQDPHKSAQYHQNDTKEFIQRLSEYRNLWHIKQRPASGYHDDGSLAYVMDSGHMTCHALEGLAEKIDSFGNQPISAEQIHEIAQKSVERAMARMVYTMAHMDESTYQQLLILCNSGFNQDTGKLEINPNLNEEHLAHHFVDDLLERIKPLAGEDWVNNFNARIERLKGTELERLLKPETVLDIAVRPAKFDHDLNACITWNNPELKECYMESILDDDIIDTNKANLTNEIAIRLKHLEDTFLPEPLSDNPQRAKADLPDKPYFERAFWLESQRIAKEKQEQRQEAIQKTIDRITEQAKQRVLDHVNQAGNKDEQEKQRKASSAIHQGLAKAHIIIQKMKKIRDDNYNSNNDNSYDLNKSEPKK
jgi:hypothetical protein